MDPHESTRSHILQLVVVTPEATVLDETAEFVALPLFDGEIGIAPLHSPMIGRLGYGEMRVTHGGRVARYYLDGGFVQVVDDVVSVLTGRALPAGTLDAEVAVEQLNEARRRPSNTLELMGLRDRAELQARAQLRVARHAGAAVHSANH
ncbi:MAG TPA: ATP synthase F1 subunit epsilon [Pirellulales bacterium]|nr:ATP synthase F1 subunit epsilon [Pirellulales bacterium]HVA50982.1 ATP synthase F1 subunit epsilon [Pirellulales bacterium]